MLDDGHSNNKIKQRNNIDIISMAMFCHIYYNDLGEWSEKDNKYTYHGI